MLNKKKNRLAPEVSAGSMADIAFLLLIFFLVTTTIIEDKGIIVRLPPWEEDSNIKPPGKNILSLKINGQGELMFEREAMPVHSLQKQVMTFIMNKEKRRDRPSSPNKAVISLQNDRATEYEDYIEVYNILRAAYSELWDQEARVQHGKAFDDVSVKQQKAIKKKIPMVISEAEPSDFARS